MRIDWMDAEELAAKLCGMGDEYDSDDVESRLYERFDVSFESFHKIVDALAPMALRSKSELTGKVYAGFAEFDGRGALMIAKVEVDK